MLTLISVPAPDPVDLSELQPKLPHRVRSVLRYVFHELRGSLSLQGQGFPMFEKCGNFRRVLFEPAINPRSAQIS
jgi:hypothetical protein